MALREPGEELSAERAESAPSTLWAKVWRNMGALAIVTLTMASIKTVQVRPTALESPYSQLWS